jgi:hypothetical protein
MRFRLRQRIFEGRPVNQAAALTLIFLDRAGAGFGTVTLNTPLDITALILSAFTPSGSWTDRMNEP